MIRLVCDIRFHDVEEMIEHLKEFVEDAVQLGDTDEEVKAIMENGGEGQFNTQFECEHVDGYGSVTIRKPRKRLEGVVH